MARHNSWSIRRGLIGILSLALLAACGADPSSNEPAPNIAPVAQRKALSAEHQATFDRSCKICHGVAGSGAPGIGDEEAWAPRVAQGLELLLDHSINGVGGMPPMGMCMECSQDDLVAFIEYMTGLECEQ